MATNFETIKNANGRYKSDIDTFISLKDMLSSISRDHTIVKEMERVIDMYNQNGDTTQFINSIRKSITDVNKFLQESHATLLQGDDMIKNLSIYTSFLRIQRKQNSDASLNQAIDGLLIQLGQIENYLKTFQNDPKRYAQWRDFYLSKAEPNKGKVEGIVEGARGALQSLGNSLGVSQLPTTADGTKALSQDDIKNAFGLILDPKTTSQAKVELIQKQTKELRDFYNKFQSEFENHIKNAKDSQRVLKGQVGDTIDEEMLSDVDVAWYNFPHHAWDLVFSDNYTETGTKMRDIIKGGYSRKQIAEIGLNTKFGYPAGLNYIGELFGADMRNITEEQWFNFFRENHKLDPKQAKDLAKKMSFVTGELSKIEDNLKSQLRELSGNEIPSGIPLTVNIGGSVYGPFDTYEEKAQYISYMLAMMEGVFNDKSWTLPISASTILYLSNLPSTYITKPMLSYMLGDGSIWSKGALALPFILLGLLNHVFPTTYFGYKTLYQGKNFLGGMFDKFDEYGKIKGLKEQLAGKAKSLLEIGEGTTLDGVGDNDVKKARNFWRYEEWINSIVEYIDGEAKKLDDLNHKLERLKTTGGSKAEIKKVEGEIKRIQTLLAKKGNILSLKESVVMTFNESAFLHELRNAVSSKGWMSSDFGKTFLQRNMLGGARLVQSFGFKKSTKGAIFRGLTGKNGTSQDFEVLGISRSVGINGIKDSSVRDIYFNELKSSPGKAKDIAERVKMYSSFEEELMANIKDFDFSGVKDKLLAIARERVKDTADFKTLFDPEGGTSIVKLIGEIESEIGSLGGFKSDIITALEGKLGSPSIKSYDILKKIHEIHTEIIGNGKDGRLVKLIEKTKFLDGHSIAGKSLGETFREIIREGLLNSNDDRIADLKAILGDELGPKLSKLLQISDTTLRENLLKKLIGEIEQLNLNGMNGIETILEVPEKYSKFKTKLNDITDTTIRDKILKEVEAKGLSASNIEPYVRDGGYIDSYLKIQKEVLGNIEIDPISKTKIETSIEEAFKTSPTDWIKIERTYNEGTQLIRIAERDHAERLADRRATQETDRLLAANGKSATGGTPSDIIPVTNTDSIYNELGLKQEAHELIEKAKIQLLLNGDDVSMQKLGKLFNDMPPTGTTTLDGLKAVISERVSGKIDLSALETKSMDSLRGQLAGKVHIEFNKLTPEAKGELKIPKGKEILLKTTDSIDDALKGGEKGFFDIVKKILKKAL